MSNFTIQDIFLKFGEEYINTHWTYVKFLDTFLWTNY